MQSVQHVPSHATGWSHGAAKQQLMQKNKKKVIDRRAELQIRFLKMETELNRRTEEKPRQTKQVAHLIFKVAAVSHANNANLHLNQPSNTITNSVVLFIVLWSTNLNC